MAKKTTKQLIEQEQLEIKFKESVKKYIKENLKIEISCYAGRARVFLHLDGECISEDSTEISISPSYERGNI
jgi:hypothetical protein